MVLILKTDLEGIVACMRKPARASQHALYQIYVKTKDFVGSGDCVDVEGLEVEALPDSTPIGVWQYV